MRTVDEQRIKREAVHQIRLFMNQFELGSEVDIAEQLQSAEQELAEAERERGELERARFAQTHPTDPLREELRSLGAEIARIREAITDSAEAINEQRALRAELVTAKIKAERADQAGQILEGVHYRRCPECGIDISDRSPDNAHCRLCGSTRSVSVNENSIEIEALRRDFNERIDQIAMSIMRREREHNRTLKLLVNAEETKKSLDIQLQEELARYDSAFVESIRTAERKIATFSERIRSLRRLEQMPQAINALEEEAGALQGRIDRLRTSMAQERERLYNADANIAAITTEFKRVMNSVSFPGVADDDQVNIDPRNWKPVVIHGDLLWSFWDAGSGGKKTLFNVSYALALHAVALRHGMPVPCILIIDSPTKNISEDENPELVRSLYNEIYRLASGQNGHGLQFLLIDSDLVMPEVELPDFLVRRMAGTSNAPSLIPYYTGP